MARKLMVVLGLVAALTLGSLVVAPQRQVVNLLPDGSGSSGECGRPAVGCL